MSRIPEPHEVADAYYAEKEAAWERLTRYAVCSDCTHYNEAPEDYVKVPCGWCDEFRAFMRWNDEVHMECDSFEPTDDYISVLDERWL